MFFTPPLPIKEDELVKKPYAPWGAKQYEKGIFMASRECPLMKFAPDNYGRLQNHFFRAHQRKVISRPVPFLISITAPVP
jgi:hypothetical protein